MLNSRQLFSIFAAFVLALTVLASINVSAASSDKGDDKRAARRVRVEAPLNLAILIQDDLVAKVANELPVTGEFIRSLPAGSRVMIGYIRSGSLQVRQPFTDDLERAARSLRMPVSSETAAPYNPYVEVIEALRKFDEKGANRNAILLISDGLDVSRGFDVTSAGMTLDLERAIREAQRRNVTVYSFYAPTVGLTSNSHRAASYGQSSLNRLSNETGGRAFFQGTTDYVSFNPYFDQLRQALNDSYARAY